MLGFDVGLARVGVALGNAITGDARALRILVRTSNRQLFADITSLIGQWQPDALVVGRPLTDDGRAQATTGLAERFARQLGGRFGLPVTLVDERYSSLAAQAEIGNGRRAWAGASGPGPRSMRTMPRRRR
ncbi:MAG: Holliday junction resolvase RuvX [Burkholderiaceae bacterium]